MGMGFHFRVLKLFWNPIVIDAQLWIYYNLWNVNFMACELDRNKDVIEEKKCLCANRPPCGVAASLKTTAGQRHFPRALRAGERVRIKTQVLSPDGCVLEHCFHLS